MNFVSDYVARFVCIQWRDFCDGTLRDLTDIFLISSSMLQSRVRDIHRLFDLHKSAKRYANTTKTTLQTTGYLHLAPVNKAGCHSTIQAHSTAVIGQCGHYMNTPNA